MMVYTKQRTENAREIRFDTHGGELGEKRLFPNYLVISDGVAISNAVLQVRYSTCDCSLQRIPVSQVSVEECIIR